MEKKECLFTIWRKRKAEKDMTRNEKKRFDIIEAARVTFLEKGFDPTSMDEIAKRACVSKRTVYSNFGSKEELFSGLMNQMCKGKREVIDFDLDPDKPIKECLIEMGDRFLIMIFDPDGMALFRMLIGNANNFSEIGKLFYEQGPKDFTDEIARYLDVCADKGLIKIQDSFISAQCLLASMMGAQQIRCLVSNEPGPDEETRSKMVRIAVDQFLNGVQIQPARK